MHQTKGCCAIATSSREKDRTLTTGAAAFDTVSVDPNDLRRIRQSVHKQRNMTKYAGGDMSILSSVA